MRKQSPDAVERPGVYHLGLDCSIPLHLFCEAIGRTAPEVFEALRNDVLPKCDPAFDDVALGSVVCSVLWNQKLPERCRPSKKRQQRIVRSVFEPIWTWASRFHLVASSPDSQGRSMNNGTWSNYHLQLIFKIYDKLKVWADPASVPKNGVLDAFACHPLSRQPPSREMVDIDEYWEQHNQLITDRRIKVVKFSRE